MPRVFTRFFAASAFNLMFACAAVFAADLQPRSYSWLLSHADVVAVGTVDGVSAGFMSDGRKATIKVNGLIKGKIYQQPIEVSWNDKEFEETAYKDDSAVVVFLDMKKDTTYAQVSPGISCWPVEKVIFKGKPQRAVEYAYPMDLLTEVPASALKETETVEKSMNFQVAKRKQWILADALLPPAHAVVLPKPPKPKPVAKAMPKPPKPVKPVKTAARTPKGKTKKTWF